MSHPRFLPMAILSMTLFVTAPSFADNVPGGSLIVRDGAANTDANYNGEDKDINNRLERVSALCSAKNQDRTRTNAQTLIGTDKTRTWAANYGTAKVSTVTGQGAKVVTDSQPKNPNHCLISGLTVSQIKGVWTMCTAASC